jgi:hypothetical protein
MHLPTIPHSLWWLVGPFAAWRIYARFKRLLARQHYSVWKHGCSVVGLSVLTAFVAYVAAEEHSSLTSLAGGLCIGALLGGWGLRRTDFEPRDEGLIFTPDRYVGAALSAVLVCRIVWRLAQGSTSASGWSMDEFVGNPSTLFLYGLFSGHYILFATGLSIWSLPGFRKRRPFGSTEQ